ncbi:hypothetical protein OG819_42400 [Streptomyces sp. NBC_01549]|uniref:hypothetical protein n=1 Tax=Streptomyces sp. NBC_01549 TaxID=2975874 RepID=UPI0022583F04|nr:hypothetical protein [Streptomyces sp. NBC_01549]MCX4596067.1 hypothetical protein [Streptomyces sp. NBC_01549]
MTRAPARRTPRPRTENPPTSPGSPVEIRLVGHKADVRRLVAAIQGAADGSAGPVSYRLSRYTEGALRAYLTVVIPPAEEQL